MKLLNEIGGIRLRLMLGAGAIAALALLASLMLIIGSLAIANRIENATTAERRIELLGTLSARINDYALTAVELSNSGTSNAQGMARLTSARSLVEGEFQNLHRAIASDVARATSDIESNRRATRGLGLERMRARFVLLADRLTVEGALADQGGFRAELDGFATQFSPELDQMLGQESRIRNAAFSGITALRERFFWVAAGIVGLALIAVPLFYFGLVAPILNRIRQTIGAAQEIGAGRFETRLGVDRHDELGLLFANVNRMAGKLDRRALSIETDRARLNEIVAERTEALRSANDELTRIDDNRRRFFSDVSHELRTPLTVIMSEADLGLRSTTASDGEGHTGEVHAGFKVIRSRARRLNRRIDDLLRIARSQAGEFDLDTLPFDVAEAARQALEDADGLARRQKVAMSLSAGDNLLSVGDGDWIRQVFLGLIENALRHSEPGSRIELRLSSDSINIHVEVIDEGGGIPADELDGVFERFARGSRKQELGFGVGLALARWLVDRHSGEIALSSPAPISLSEPPRGPGTCATIILPRLLDGDDDG